LPEIVRHPQRLQRQVYICYSREEFLYRQVNAEGQLSLNVRSKLIITGVLLSLALGLTIFCAAQAVRAVQRFQESRHMTLTGDVGTIRPWMTIPFVSKVYHVPESYLLQRLNISDPRSVQNVTLHSLSGRLHRTPETLIHEIQIAIQTYRKQRPSRPQPGRLQGVAPPPVGRKEI
jgi:hypothetical protein